MKSIRQMTIMPFMVLFLTIMVTGCGSSSVTHGTATGTSIVEGYIYAPSSGSGRAAASHAASFPSSRTASETATSTAYTPLTDANVKMQCGRTSITATTDANGHYRIERVPAGSCSVTVTATGYPALGSSIEVEEGKTQSFMRAIDGRQLGRAKVEFGSNDADINVAFTQGGITATSTTDINGVYPLPSFDGFSDGPASVTATKDCSWYLQATASVVLKKEEFAITELILLQKMRYSVSTNKIEYDYNNSLEEIYVCLDIENRTQETISYSSSHYPPDVLIRNKTTGVGSYFGDPYPDGQRLFEIASNRNHFCRVVYVGDARRFGDTGVYEVGAAIPNVEIPVCVGLDAFKITVNHHYITLK